MRVFLAAILLIGLGVFGMCFNIIFRKDGEFPETEISKNKEMRRLGIKCMNELERERLGCTGKEEKASCTGNYSEACGGCSFHASGRQARPAEAIDD